MTNPILKLMVGAPASGKSTLCERMLAADTNLIRVSRDEYRYMWRNEGWLPSKMENLITDRVKLDIGYFLRNKYNVVYDATNTSASYLNDFVKQFSNLADIEFIVMDTDVEECIRRDKLRERSVGEKVIRDHHAKFMVLKANYKFDPIAKSAKKYNTKYFALDKGSSICIDIDGTLADIGDRSPYDCNVYPDKVVGAVKDVLNAMSYYHGHTSTLQIMLITGREEKTVWKQKNG